jgi:hypothetical protein
MAFMASSLDDDSIPANARVWDFVMPPESCWTIPLSSECVSGKRLCLGPSDLLYKSSVQRHPSVGVCYVGGHSPSLQLVFGSIFLCGSIGS